MNVNKFTERMDRHEFDSVMESQARDWQDKRFEHEVRMLTNEKLSPTWTRCSFSGKSKTTTKKLA